MKVIFLLDNNEFAEIAPEKLQIRQIGPGQSALGTEVTVPLRKDDGTPELDEDGTPKTATGFRPFINYAVNLWQPQVSASADIEHLKTLVKTKEEELTKAGDVVDPNAPIAEAKKATKAKAAKKRVN